MADERFDGLGKRILEKLDSIEMDVKDIDDRLRTLKRLATDLEIAYICDRNRCEDCQPDCYLTRDVEHAVNFTCLGEGKWGSAKYSEKPDGRIRQAWQAVEKSNEICWNCNWAVTSVFNSGKALKMYCVAWGDGMQGEWTRPNGHCHKWKKRDDGYLATERERDEGDAR